MRRSSQQRQEFQVFGAQPSSAGSAQFPPAKHMQDFATHDQLQPEQHYSSRDIRRTHYGGQHYHQQQRQHPQHEAVVMHSLDDDAAYYDGSHPLPPSDPIYMDIESDRTGQPQLGQRGSSAQRRQRPVPEYSTQMYESSVTSPNNYHRSQQRTLISHRPPQPPSARKPTRKVPVTNNTPIMFGDPYEQGSVMTGMSQQELLRKKSREHSKQKKEKSRFRKKKKDRIVNMPGSLLGGTKYQRAAEDSKETSRKVPVYEIKQKSTIRLPAVVQQVSASTRAAWLNPGMEEKGSNATESTLEESRETSFDLPYSSIQVQEGVINEGSVGNWLMPPTGDEELDGRSLGECSFPLLSTSANNSGMVNDSRVSTGMGEPNGDYNDMAWSNNSANPKAGTRRGVTFAESIATSTLVYDRHLAADASEIPWDEQNDNSSPTTVRDLPTFSTPPRGNKSQPSSKPVSILRSRRFVSEMGSPSFERTRLYAGSNSPPRPDSSPYRAIVETADRSNTSIVLSPPRNSGFVDMDGVEVSPIRPSRSPSDRQSRGMSYGLDNLSEKHSFGDYNPVHYNPEHAGVEASRELHPDPPLELDIDEESTIASVHMSFIEAVAAIVVQTAYRRYMAAKDVEELWAQRYTAAAVSARSPTAVEHGRSQSAVESELARRAEEEEYTRVAAEYERAQGVENEFVESANSLKHSQPQASVQQRGASFDQEGTNEFESLAFRMCVLATVRIQSAFRGFWVRDCLSVDQYCATVIQKAFRRFRLRNNFHYDMYRIVIVQSVWRGSIVRGKVSSNKLASIVCIQAAFRGFRIRRALFQMRQRVWQVDRARRAQRVVAATRIQGRWRSFIAETYFIRTLVDILIAQTIVRRWLAKRRLVSLRKAAAKREATKQQPQQVQASQQVYLRHNQHQPVQESLPVYASHLNDVSFEDEPGQIVSSAVKVSTRANDNEPCSAYAVSTNEASCLRAVNVPECRAHAFDESMPMEEKKMEMVDQLHQSTAPSAADSSASAQRVETAQVEIDESPGSATNLLSMWKQREKKNAYVIGSKR